MPSRGLAVSLGFVRCPHTLSYSSTHHITPPLWAFKTKVTRAIVGCRRKPTSEKCFGCGVQVLCREHSGLGCSRCRDEDATRDLGNVEAGDASSLPPLQHMVTCLIPAPRTTLYTSHYEAAPAPHVIDPGTTPRPHDCPLVGHIHESE